VPLEIQKTLEINTLFDFYGPLLTKKQQEYMQLYYRDDFSLGEIAQEFDVSRQAVYDNVKRSETALNDYEGILHLAHDFKKREEAIEKAQKYVAEYYYDDSNLIHLINSITKDSNGEEN